MSQEPQTTAITIKNKTIKLGQFVKIQDRLHTDAAMASYFGISYSSIRQVRKRFGLPSSARSNRENQTKIKGTLVSREDLLRLQEMLGPDRAIAAFFGCAVSRISHARHVFRIPPVAPDRYDRSRPRGQKSQFGFTPEKLKKLQQKYGSNRAIARAMGCSEVTIWKWMSRNGMHSIRRMPGMRKVGKLGLMSRDEFIAILNKVQSPKKVAKLAECSPAGISVLKYRWGITKDSINGTNGPAKYQEDQDDRRTGTKRHRT